MRSIYTVVRVLPHLGGLITLLGVHAGILSILSVRLTPILVKFGELRYREKTPLDDCMFLVSQVLHRLKP